MSELQITEYKNVRVLTTQQIAEAYGTDNKTISYNFRIVVNIYWKFIIFCSTGGELRCL